MLCYDGNVTSSFGHGNYAIKFFCQISNFPFGGGGTSNFGHAKSAINFFCHISNFTFQGGLHQPTQIYLWIKKIPILGAEGTSLGRSVNFDSFSEIGYRSP